MLGAISPRQSVAKNLPPPEPASPTEHTDPSSSVPRGASQTDRSVQPPSSSDLISTIVPRAYSAHLCVSTGCHERLRNARASASPHPSRVSRVFVIFSVARECKQIDFVSLENFRHLLSCRLFFIFAILTWRGSKYFPTVPELQNLPKSTPPPR